MTVADIDYDRLVRRLAVFQTNDRRLKLLRRKLSFVGASEIRNQIDYFWTPLLNVMTECEEKGMWDWICSLADVKRLSIPDILYYTMVHLIFRFHCLIHRAAMTRFVSRKDWAFD